MKVEICYSSFHIGFLITLLNNSNWKSEVFLIFRCLSIGSVLASSSHDFLNRNDISSTALYGDIEKSLLALSAGEVEVLVYDKTVLEYLISKMQLGNKMSLLPANFNIQYRSFFLPKNSEHLGWINPVLVREINDPSWQELLHNYNLRIY